MKAATERKEETHSHNKGDMRFRIAGILMNQVLRDARLTVNCRDNGAVLTVGKKDGQSFAMVVENSETLWNIIKDPDPGLGEAYMDGKWEMEESDIGAFVTTLARNRQRLFEGPMGAFFTALLNKRPPDYDHSIKINKGQVQHHYDIGNDLYELFLDEGLNYSCAFFEKPTMSLGEAQENKIKTSIERLDVQKGAKVLDIGCGWGAVSCAIAETTEADSVTGISLAENQIEVAKERVIKLGNKISYSLQDYREHAEQNQGAYDRIISIGMFEHVGDKTYNEFFEAVSKQLVPGGKALIHSIVRSGAQSTRKLSSPWLDSYIFPGGCIPYLPDMLAAAKEEGLETVCDPYLHDHFHYAETLRRWRENFLLNAGKLDSAKYDDRFKRMWIYYLAMCEAMFDGCGYQVGQIVFKKL